MSRRYDSITSRTHLDYAGRHAMGQASGDGLTWLEDLAHFGLTFLIRTIPAIILRGWIHSHGVCGMAKPKATAPDKEASKESAPAGGKRILLVDDDPEVIEALRYALESKGYSILIARDGNQGLAMAEREDPDLVILDMMMPKRSGFLVLEKLRRTRPVPVRVIMITANEGSRHKAYAEMLGVDDYIRKPFAMDRLVESVDRLLA
jgi:CheY-like chemotaxis protein